MNNLDNPEAAENGQDVRIVRFLNGDTMIGVFQPAYSLGWFTLFTARPLYESDLPRGDNLGALALRAFLTTPCENPRLADRPWCNVQAPMSSILFTIPCDHDAWRELYPMPEEPTT